MALELNRADLDHARHGTRFLIFRVLIVLLGFGLVSFYEGVLNLSLREGTRAAVYWLLGGYLIFAVLALVLHVRSRTEVLKPWQVVVDFGVQASLTWLTGGVLSIFTPLLFLTLVAATRIISARGSLVLASLATVALAGTTIAYSVGVGPAAWGSDGTALFQDTPNFVRTFLVANVLGLYTISALGSVLSNGLLRIEGIHSEIIENMDEGLIAVDNEGRVVNLNRESRQLLGLEESPVPGRIRLGELLAGDRFESLRTAFGSGERRRFAMVIQNLAGEDRHVEVKISSVKDQNGKPRFAIGLISDLTLKREVAAAENRIQKLEDLHVMAMGIAHEIRNPLASIRGCVQELDRPDREAATQTRLVEIICRESDRLDRILEDFLLYARTGPADLAPVDLVEIVEEALILIRTRPEFGNRRIEWTPETSECRVLGDRNRLTQLFLNLGLNSLEATGVEDGAIRISITSGERRIGERRGTGEGAPLRGVEVRFGDNGRGIQSETMEKLFTPFFTTKGQGSGLGLSIVDKVVRDHRGLLQVESPPEGGTTFRIWLPLATSTSEISSTAGVEEVRNEAVAIE